MILSGFGRNLFAGKQMLDDCDACICALTEFGPYNEKIGSFMNMQKLAKVCAEI